MHPAGEPSDARPRDAAGGPAAARTREGGETPGPATPTHRPTADQRRQEAIVAWLARQQRPTHERDLGIGRAIGGIRREVATKRRRLGTLIDPWEQLVPEAIKQRSRVDGLRGDTLMVTVDGPATSWQLDRLLRSGLTQSFARASADRIRKVRVRVGSIAADSDEPARG